LLALFTSETIAAREQRTLEPSSVWLLDYADERCSLVRDFGADQDRVQLQLVSYGDWNNFRLMVSGPGLTPSSKPFGFASVRFAGDADDREADAVYGTLGETKDPAASFGASFTPYLDWTDLRWLPKDQRKAARDENKKPDPAFDATVEALLMQLERGPALDFRTGNMAKPLAALRVCIDDLVKTWGVDPAAQKALSRPAKPVRSTIRRLQYPSRALENGINAYVPVRLLIDATGNAETCTVQANLVDPQFKKNVCDGLAGKFEPALDANGKPIASMYSTSVYFSAG
jgi:hypothetical protein